MSPSTSLTHRNNKSRNGPAAISNKQHTRKTSKLREITSQLNLPEALASATDSAESVGSGSGTAAHAITDSSGSSSDESLLSPQSSSLILRPKGNTPGLSLPSSPRQGAVGNGDSMNGNGYGNGLSRGDESKSMVIPIDSKSPALTAPRSPGRPKVARWIAVMPQVWLIVKILLFFLKVMSMTNRCLPMAPNPWVFNSLLLLALVDLFG
ncbi:hypothetical protein ABW21_db0208890 [Orbilia brochopaga]|nr:hypothetical protein ABW21_db0208890 [Drechslerella brochopaga]